MQDTRVMIWLLPDEVTRVRLLAASTYLRDVAGDALPAVEPHLTLSSGVTSIEPTSALARPTRSAAPLTLSLSGPAVYPDPSKPGFRIHRSMYLPFENAVALHDLRQGCCRALGLSAPILPFEPHVSLAYTLRSKRAKKKFAAKLHRRGGSTIFASRYLRFEAIEVRRDVPHEDFGTRMRSWKVLARATLTGDSMP